MPYVREPEGTVVGRPLFFATAASLAGDVQGLLVETHEGRPTKIEGNPDHPANRKPSGNPPAVRFGPTDMQCQASILDLYDPDRSRTVTHLGNIASWDAFVTELRRRLGEKPRPTSPCAS